MSNTVPPLVLASGSAIRADLLRRAGLGFEVSVASLDEEEIKASFKAGGASPADCAIALAELKAARVSPHHPGALVVGTDQILELDGIWFDKPQDRVEARRHLAKLSGKTHRLLTAAVVVRDGARIWHTLDEARLTMRDLTDEALDSYLARAGSAILSSVGAYHIEALGINLFSRVEGDFFTIQGLPLLPLLAFLREHGITL